MDVLIREADPGDIPLIRDLAERTWRACYPGMISPQQIEYMLERMYDPAVLADEIGSGTLYLLVFAQGKPAGYLAFSDVRDDREILLHKLYVLPHLQGQGLGRRMLDEARRRATALGARRIGLYVNKRNDRALKLYARYGFVKAAAVVNDIGGGFVMDDYRMELELDPVQR